METQLVNQFKDKTVLVVGDLMIDKYLYGVTDRISPEAPVPVVRVNSEENIPGGAANAANNLVSLGAKVIVAGVVGKDEQGAVLKKLLESKRMDTSMIFEDSSRPTTVKKRIISGNNYQLLRVDYETTTEISRQLQDKLLQGIKAKIGKVDSVVLSDYSKGVMTEYVATEIIRMARDNNQPTIVDTKPEHAPFFRGCTLVTPNLKEAIGISGISQDVIGIGKRIVDQLQCNVYITRGADGISVFDRKGNHTHVPPVKVTKLFDVTGAGDTVVAVSALCICSGVNLVETAKIANHAAGLVVQKPGTATVSPEELRGAFRHQISRYLRESIDVKQKVIDGQIGEIEKAANFVINAYHGGNKVIAFGNGGSASDAQHLVGELVGRFKIERRALPAIALTTDSSVVTAIANDYGYDRIFERQIEANALTGDVVVGISTSGNSPNVLNAIQKAKDLGCRTIGLSGKEGGKLGNLCDVSIVVPSDNTPRIQEAHIAIIHIICELLDAEMQRLKT